MIKLNKDQWTTWCSFDTSWSDSCEPVFEWLSETNLDSWSLLFTMFWPELLDLALLSQKAVVFNWSRFYGRLHQWHYQHSRDTMPTLDWSYFYNSNYGEILPKYLLMLSRRYWVVSTPLWDLWSCNCYCFTQVSKAVCQTLRSKPNRFTIKWNNTMCSRTTELIVQTSQFKQTGRCDQSIIVYLQHVLLSNIWRINVKPVQVHDAGMNQVKSIRRNFFHHKLCNLFIPDVFRRPAVYFTVIHP